MLTFPFRLLSTLAFALFCYSKWVRRAVAGVAISAAIVAAQHQDMLQALAGQDTGHGSLIRALSAIAGG
ncbi:hypothetical protein [Aestuariivirga sp.]|uniref:hypothetical protein n=1 Tax=Aestuariivirga sp. TaxID=2650926 RepID=UPI003BA9AB58